MTARWWVMALLLGCSAPDPEEAPDWQEDPAPRIAGLVFDAVTGEPLQGATVTTSPAAGQGLSDARGYYSIALGLQVDALYQVSASLAGYATNFVSVTAREGVVRDADIPLSLAEPQLEVSADTLDFGPAGDALTFSVRNTGDATTELAWGIADSEPWVASISPQTGTLAGGAEAIVTVRLDRTALGTVYGARAALLSITSDGGVAYVDLRLEHPDPNAPHLSYTQGTVTFGASDTLEVAIENDGTGVLSWSAASDVPWLTVSPVNGELEAGVSSTVTLAANRDSAPSANLAAGLVTFESNSVVQDMLPLRVRLASEDGVELAFSESTLDFSTWFGERSVELTNNSDVGVRYVATTDSAWMSVEPAVGDLEAFGRVSLLVRVDRRSPSMGDGEFSGELTVAAEGATAQLAVAGDNSQQPRLCDASIGPGDVTFVGHPLTTSTISFRNCGAGGMGYRLSSPDAWVAFSQDQGLVEADAWGYSGLELDMAALSPGEHTATVVLETLLPGDGQSAGAVVDRLVMTTTLEAFPIYWEEALPHRAGIDRDRGAAMAYDPILDRVVMVDGGTFGNTWTFDGSTWSQVVAAGGPIPGGGSLVWDPSRGKILLVKGGVWQFDGAGWTSLAVGAPPIRGGGFAGNSLRQAVFDPRRGALVAYGHPQGADRDRPPDLWWLDGDTWKQLEVPYIQANAQWVNLVVADEERVWFFTPQPWFETAGGAWALGDVPDQDLETNVHFYGGRFIQVHQNRVAITDLGNGEVSELYWGGVYGGGLVPGYWSLSTVDTRRNRLLVTGGQAWQGETPMTLSVKLSGYGDPIEAPLLSLDATSVAGTVTGTLIQLNNAGTGILDWHIGTDDPRVIVDPSYGRTGSEGAAIEVRLVSADGFAGATLTVRSDGGEQTIVVTAP